MNDWGFAENERAKLLRWAQLSYADRLRWLWEAKIFAQRALAAAQARSKLDAIAATPETMGKTG